MEWRKSPYELLRSKDIIAILDGDTSFGAYEVCKGKSIDVRMPYLSGQSLCDISNKFGLPVKYVWGGSNLSRWQYLDNLMEHCWHICWINLSLLAYCPIALSMKSTQRMII